MYDVSINDFYFFEDDNDASFTFISDSYVDVLRSLFEPKLNDKRFSTLEETQ